MRERKILGVVWTYTGLCFGLGILLSMIIGFTGGFRSPWINLGYFSMFIPAIVLILLISTKSTQLSLSWSRFPMQWLPVALFIFPVIIHAICVPLFASQNGFHLPWLSWLTIGGDGLYHSPTTKNWGDLTKAGLIVRILINAFFGLIVVSVLAFFEEIGWRGWLLPKLMERIGVKEGIMVTAFIAAIWHIPLNLSGIQHIHNALLWVVILFQSLGLFGAGIILGWLWKRTGSIWMVSLAHGSLNNWGQYAFKYMADAKTAHQLSVLIGALNLSLFVSGLLILLNLKRENRSSFPQTAA